MRPSPSRPVPADTGPSPVPTLFAGLLGLFLGVGLLKWGNPVILDRLVEMPRNFDEWRIFAWPVRIGHFALIPVAILGVLTWQQARERSVRAPKWILGCIVGWFLWQVVASMSSIDPATSKGVLMHFACCVVCFGLGHFALSRVEEPRVFWLCIALGFVGVLAFAFEQHFGGLEATRRMILERPESATLPPEYLARIQSNRVFSTLVYPNALASAVLLVLPLTTVLSYRWGAQRGENAARVFAGGTLAAGLLVLVWSGSKAGWLIAMGIALVVLFHSTLSRKLKIGVALGFVVAGLVAFGIIFAEKLARGPTSVAARVDYWSAAWTGFKERPVTGQGPGAFKRVYARVKRPESEMAQLAHNDYLQQATDSGLPGFIAYSAFVVGSLAWLYRRRRLVGDALFTATGLGVAAWFAHALVEFALYIPATSWCAFTLLGWLLAKTLPERRPTP